MKITDIYKFLHALFTVFFILCFFITDYAYLPYFILFSYLILIGWIINKNCFLHEYEDFISCIYDNEYNKCENLNKNVTKSLGFYLDKNYFQMILLILLLQIRYYYNYNFITFNNPLYKRILVSVFCLIFNILFFLILIPVVSYHKIYNDKKQLYLYIIYYLIIIIISYYYYKRVIIKSNY